MTIGKKIRHFEIIDRLGEGAMGEVFKARDLRLGRSVALKVLKPELMTSSARDRFLREAVVASSLNHINIVTIFEAFTENETDLIAMELVTGRTLADLISGKALPPATVLDFALQIADALNAAHRAGIVHRDLKPRNIMVTEDGVVKVLDFGLAKVVLTGERKSLAVDAQATTIAAHDSSRTAAGIIMGTAAYMSPEQADGKPLDARSDIFSFGSILYEMLAGRQAFQADTAMSTLAAILTQQPFALSELSPGVPPLLESIVFRCLRKDVERRFQTAADLRAALLDVRDELGAANGPAAPAKPATRRMRGLWLWGAAIVALALAGIWIYHAQEQTRIGSAAAVFANSVPLTSFRGNETSPSFSPDGNQFAFSWDGERSDNSDIYIKLVGPGRPVRITTDPRPDVYPSWSPDGQSVAFWRQLADNEASLIVVPALGGRERSLANLKLSYILGASKPVWSRDMKWLVVSAATSDEGQQGLARVGVESGQISWITRPGTASRLNDVMPALSPNGRMLAFSRVGGGFVTAAFVLPVSDDLVPSGQPKGLDQGGIPALTPEWLDDDELIVATGGVQSALWKVSASGKTPVRPLVVTGTDVVQPSVNHSTHRLAYVSKTQDPNIWSVDLDNHRRAAAAPVRVIASTQSDVNPQISPDGKRVVFASNRSGKYEIWIWDPESPDAYQLTTLGAPTTGSPRWSPDGRLILFDSNLGGLSNIYVVSAEGGTPRKLTQGVGANVVPCWSNDGGSIFFGSNRTGLFQIWKMNADGTSPTMVTKGGGFAARLSTDGEFIYYAKSPGLASDIWRVPIRGGPETKITKGVYRFSFAPTPNGLFFLSAPGFPTGSAVRFLEFAGGAITDVLSLGDPVDLGLGLSSDYRRLLFSKIDYRDSDIMLVENVR